MNLAGYIRVSHRSSKNFVSAGAQRDEIDAFCTLHGHHIATWHDDLDEPGTKAPQPGLERALARIEASETDGIVVAKLDRIAPSMAAAAAALRRVDDAGGRLVSVEEKFDTGTPTGKFALHMILALAQLEVDRIRDTWARAQESAVNRGVHIASRPPTGYRRGADGRLEPVESAAPAIADLFRRRAAGASWKELAGILEGAGIVGPYGGTAWTTGAVRKVIENPVYTGQARSGQHHKDGAHPALVSEAEWRAAQLTRRTVSPLRSPSGALLAGLLRCAGCRYVMKPDTITSREGNLRQYRCRGEHAAGRCPAPTSVLAHVIEPRVVAAFFAELGPDGVLTRPAADRAATERAPAGTRRRRGRIGLRRSLRSPPACPRSGPTSRHRIDGSSSLRESTRSCSAAAATSQPAPSSCGPARRPTTSRLAAAASLSPRSRGPSAPLRAVATTRAGRPG